MFESGGLLLSALHVPNPNSLDSAVNSNTNPAVPEALNHPALADSASNDISPQIAVDSMSLDSRKNSHTNPPLAEVLSYPVLTDLASDDDSSPQSLVDANSPPPVITTNHLSEFSDDNEPFNPVPPTSTKLTGQDELPNPSSPIYSAELAGQEELANSVSPPPVVIIQPCPEPSHSIEEIKQEIQLAVERELEDTKKTLLLLKKNYEEKIADLLQQFDSYKVIISPYNLVLQKKK